MKVTILDTLTGETGVLEKIPTFQLEHNNWSCDCNRNFNNSDLGGEENVCAGEKRFLVIEAEKDHEDDYDCSLLELNHLYPKELLDTLGIYE